MLAEVLVLELIKAAFKAFCFVLRKVSEKNNRVIGRLLTSSLSSRMS